MYAQTQSHRRHRGRSMRGGGPHGRGGHRARRGDVRLAILSLLDDRAMHGYEMIQQLEERTGGRWRPSAGSIYPTLQLLEDEGLVSAEEVDGKRVFSLTDDGREAAAKRSERPAFGEDDDSAHGRLRAAGFGLIGAARQVARVGSEEQATRAAEILTDARRQLYSILAEE
jgi:DNA-binding PadR family transcriptional regulator